MPEYADGLELRFWTARPVTTPAASVNRTWKKSNGVGVPSPILPPGVAPFCTITESPRFAPSVNLPTAPTDPAVLVVEGGLAVVPIVVEPLTAAAPAATSGSASA